jgi:hypothetical protein
MRSILAVTLLTCLYCCILSKGNSNRTEPLLLGDSTIKAPSISQIVDTGYKYTFPDTLSYDRDLVFNSYYTELVDSLLLNNRLPDFIYDACLDAHTAGYCTINSHDYVSLRYDILHKLPDNLINKILVLSDSNKLNAKCEIPYMKERLSNRKTNLDILKEEKKYRRL